MDIEAAFQASRLRTGRETNADVVSAFAVDLAELAQRCDNVGAISNEAHLDTANQPVSDRLAGVGLDNKSGSQLRRGNGCHSPELNGFGTGNVIRPRPTFREVPAVAKRVKVLPPPWGKGVERSTGFQFATWNQEVNMHATVRISVKDAAPVVLASTKACERRPLDVVQHLCDLLFGGLVLRRPGDDARRVSVLGRKRIDDLCGHTWIAAEHGHLGTLFSGVVARAKKVVDSLLPVAGAMPGNRDEHFSVLQEFERSTTDHAG